MKETNLAVVLALIAGNAMSQTGFPLKSVVTPPPPASAIEWRFRVVSRLMSFPSPLQIGAVQLHGMGDEAAFHIFTFLGTSSPLTAAQTLTALDILHNAFAMPNAILNPSDRKPVQSLVVLKMLQATAVDQIVKERIAIETTFLMNVPTEVLPPPMGVPGPPPAPGTTPFF